MPVDTTYLWLISLCRMSSDVCNDVLKIYFLNNVLVLGFFSIDQGYLS